MGLSQTFPIPAEDSEWNEADVDLESIMSNHIATRFASGRDTIIDSVGYTTLYRTWSANFFQDGPCQFQYTSGPFQSNSYLGAVRTNEEQQVRFIPVDDTLSYLIYDFSLSIGDTINWIRPHNYEEFTAYITEIDSLLIESTYRKRIHLEVYNNLPDQWIEGIGSAFGFFSTFGYRSWEKVIHGLMCYRDNHIPQLLFGGYSCNMCDVVTTSKDISSNDRLKIYPIPLEESSEVELPGTALPSSYRVYDLSGRVVYSHEVKGSEQIILHREDYEEGLILLEVIDQNKKTYLKKIVVN